MIHSHDDKKIKTCSVCQKAIKEINEAGEELNRLGTWTFYKHKKQGTQLIASWNRK